MPRVLCCVCVWKEGSLADAVCLFQGELLSPCRCDGSVKCTHQPCLIKWISERGCWSCELCYYKYHVIAISTKNPLQVKVLETFQSLFILVSIFVSGSNWILPVWVFLPCAKGFICLRCLERIARGWSKETPCSAQWFWEHPSGVCSFCPWQFLYSLAFC